MNMHMFFLVNMVLTKELRLTYLCMYNVYIYIYTTNKLNEVVGSWSDIDSVTAKNSDESVKSFPKSSTTTYKPKISHYLCIVRLVQDYSDNVQKNRSPNKQYII